LKSGNPNKLKTKPNAIREINKMGKFNIEIWFYHTGPDKKQIKKKRVYGVRWKD